MLEELPRGVPIAKAGKLLDAVVRLDDGEADAHEDGRCRKVGDEHGENARNHHETDNDLPRIPLGPLQNGICNAERDRRGHDRCGDGKDEQAVDRNHQARLVEHGLYDRPVFQCGGGKRQNAGHRQQDVDQHNRDYERKRFRHPQDNAAEQDAHSRHGLAGEAFRHRAGELEEREHCGCCDYCDQPLHGLLAELPPNRGIDSNLGHNSPCRCEDESRKTRL